MTTPKLDQAREYAQWMIDRNPQREDARAAAEVIQSLPDEWIDAEKVRNIIHENTFRGAVMDHRRKAIIEELESLIPVTEPTSQTLRVKVEVDLDEIREWAQKFTDNDQHGLAAALYEFLANHTPPLPTLADLIEQGKDPADYIFHWVKTEDGIELLIMENDECVYTLDSRGYRFGRDFHEVTPLPDLPRLEWPSSGDVPTVAEQENVAPDQRVNPQVNLDSSRPRPEDVPVGEAWLVKTRDGEKREALKTSTGWMVKDGDDVELWVEEALEPVARLVPEVQS